MTTDRFRSISKRFSYALIGVISLMLAIFAVSAAFISQNRAEDYLRSKLDGNLKIAEVALRIPIWNVDYYSAQGVIDALLLDDDVVYASVVIDDVPVATKLRFDTSIGDFESLQEDSNFMTGAIAIAFEREEIGVLQVAISRQSIQKETLFNGIGILVLTLLIIGAIAATSVLISRRYVARPMQQLQASASAIAQGRLDTEIAMDRNDEIGLLARDFDSMRKSVKGLFSELTETNRNLENRVEERTAELTATSERLQLALSMDGVGIWHARFDTGDVWWSKEYTALMGRDPDGLDVHDTNWEEYLHPDNRSEVYKQFASILAGKEEVARMRKHFLRPDGSDFWVDSLMRIERNDAGEVIRMTGLDVDISEQLAREQELETVSERLSLAMQIDQVGIYDNDFKTDTLWWSPEYTAMLGHDPHTFLPSPYKSWEDRLHPSMSKRAKKEMDRFISGSEQTLRMRQHLLRPDNEEIWLDAVMRIQRDEEGAATRLTGLAVDVTEQLRREQRLSEANRQVMESLHYAGRIQSAMLPAEEAIRDATGDSFLIWEPRDIVGGDFYWHHPIQGGCAIIVGDCTGHGVPGAFMTLISCGLLDRELRSGVDAPSQLLQRLHGALQDLLGQDQAEGETDDGLEAGICFVRSADRKVIFSGARFSLFRAAGGVLSEIRGDKAGLGYRRYPASTNFTDVVFDLQQSDRFYMTTDGLIDQIGGAKRRSFGKRRFLNVINETLDSPMNQQAAALNETFKTFQGSEKRRDDVTVFGFAPGDA
ncbi:MAG: PAS domain-containing protein [Pseudomonadota bacterium]